jgi:transcriptional regulator with XRE-family HTH domain
MGTQKPQPFSTFGQALKKLRQDTSESQMEVSGAVEIDLGSLRKYEQGADRPAEDVLLLLIQHFSLKDPEANELWRLAGYENIPMEEARYMTNDDFGDPRFIYPVNMYHDDGPIVYTDMVQVMVNNYGVVMNFMQGMGAHGGPLAVARVGMSRDHAKSVLEVLKKTLDQASALEHRAKVQKQLPSGRG